MAGRSYIAGAGMALRTLEREAAIFSAVKKVLRAVDKSFDGREPTLHEKVPELISLMEKFQKHRRHQKDRSQPGWDSPVWEYAGVADKKWPDLRLIERLERMFNRALSPAYWQPITRGITHGSLEDKSLNALVERLRDQPEKLPEDFALLKPLFQHAASARGQVEDEEKVDSDELLYLRFAIRHLAYIHNNIEGLRRLIELAKYLGYAELNQRLARILWEAKDLPQTREAIVSYTRRKKTREYVRKWRAA